MIGGWDGSRRCNDIWILNTTEMKWEEFITEGILIPVFGFIGCMVDGEVCNGVCMLCDVLWTRCVRF